MDEVVCAHNFFGEETKPILQATVLKVKVLINFFGKVGFSPRRDGRYSRECSPGAPVPCGMLIIECDENVTEWDKEGEHE